MKKRSTFYSLNILFSKPHHKLPCATTVFPQADLTAVCPRTSERCTELAPAGHARA